MRITSTQNPIAKYVRSLLRPQSARDEDVFLTEGVRLVSEAVRTEQTPTTVLYDPSLLERTAEGSLLCSELRAWTSNLYEVSEPVLRAVSDTDTPAGVVAVLKRPQTVSSPIDREAGAVVVLDAIADPGNAGTILRTAAAVGCAAVLAAQGSVDLFAPKVVRAGMGAHFRLHLRQPVLYEDLRSILPGRTIMACDMDGRQSIFDLQFPATFALVVGNEAHGLSHTVRSSVDLTVRIPMAPGVESLNAAVAAAVVLYEALGRSL